MGNTIKAKIAALFGIDVIGVLAIEISRTRNFEDCGIPQNMMACNYPEAAMPCFF